MIGIYKFQNKINKKVYIGQSVNIERRKYAHVWAATHESANDYTSQFHQAIRKYGIENFDFEIVAELTNTEYTQETLNQLEKFFIKYYNSYTNGYNATEGGDQLFAKDGHQKGASNGRALLTEEDVKYIRECYNAHIPFRTVYNEYKDVISKRGLQKVWWFDTWKEIYPEYKTEENKYWHSHQSKANSSEVASNNKRKFSEDEVKEMRRLYDEGATPKEIWKNKAPEVAWSTVYNIVTKKSYKDIQ